MQNADLTVSESFVVPVALADAWSLISDLRVVVPCMPGAEILEENADGSFEGTLDAKFGPTRVKFRGKVRAEFDDGVYHGVIDASGGDARGRTKARLSTSFRLVSEYASSKTQVDLEASISASGPLAPFVRTGGAHLFRELLNQFVINISELSVLRDGSSNDLVNEDVAGPSATPLKIGHVMSLYIRSLVFKVWNAGVRSFDAIFRRRK